MLNTKHLIAGQWLGSDATFESEPAHGPVRSFSQGTTALVDTACTSAAQAFVSYSQTTRQQRADFLNAIADELDKLGDQITEVGSQETGLPTARLEGERGRTTGQLRLFAEHILAGGYLDRRHDAALPDRAPAPRQELILMQRPLGPVAVFGASNFPLAFSTAGGDTAAALAAGCPVVVKGHGAHPGTAELAAQAIDNARVKCDLHPGVFSLVQGGTRAVGAALVQHPDIKAVGFTGSLAGGRALFDLCAQRDEPIPFFGELGSVNPVFVLPAAMASRGESIAQGWAGSLSMGAGQFCTNPGLVCALAGAQLEDFIQTTAQALQQMAAQTMLTSGIAAAYNAGCSRLQGHAGVVTLVASSPQQREALPALYKTTAEVFLASPELAEEVFGPVALVVVADTEEELLALAEAQQGQLTCTLQIDPGDHGLAKTLVPILERKAGRVLANNFPTGVEVCDSMVHGGPYPASTNFGATSVGTLSIRRFLRPVCYQGIPHELLPEDAG